jgi:hypothetical protein
MGMTTENKAPRELDWVEKRATCTAEAMFLQLANGVQVDVKARNAIGNDGNFAAEFSGDKRALVIGETGAWARKERVRIFPLGRNIEVRDEICGAAFSAEVFLNDEGRCKLRLKDGIELEQWQFRRLALEALFFGGQK